MDDKEKKELIDPIEYFKVDKISDDVYALGPNVILKFSVSLSKTSNGTRHHFHKEYEYRSSSNATTLVTIKRSFDYYLSLENMQKDSNGNKVFIRIGPSEYMMFKKGLEIAISWFTDKKYEKLFASDRGKLVLVNPIPNFVVSSLPMDKYLELVPIIIDRGMANADKEPGVRIYLSSDSQFIDINLDRLMGLYYIVSSFNMYQAALEIVNYLERPALGTNRFVMDSATSHRVGGSIFNKAKSGSTGINGRLVTPQGTKDNIKDLE